MPARARLWFSILLLSLIPAESAMAFSYPLSPEAIREAYFLGIGDAAKRANVYAKYTHTFPTPSSGAYVASILFETPYLGIADQISQSPSNYHAPDAEREFLGKAISCHVLVDIEFPYNEYDNFFIRLTQNGKEIQPQFKRGSFRYWGADFPAPAGVYSDTEYPAEKINPDAPVRVQVAVENGPTVKATFDLSQLR